MYIVSMLSFFLKFHVYRNNVIWKATILIVDSDQVNPVAIYIQAYEGAG